MLSDWLSRTYKNFRKLLFCGGEFKGGEAPQSIKMGIYKAKPYFQGGWEKYRSNLNSRIIGQINFTIL